MGIICKAIVLLYGLVERDTCIRIYVRLYAFHIMLCNVMHVFISMWELGRREVPQEHIITFLLWLVSFL